MTLHVWAPSLVGKCLEVDTLQISLLYRTYNSDTTPKKPIMEILFSANSTCRATPDGVSEEVIVGENWIDSGFRARDSQGRNVKGD